MNSKLLEQRVADAVGGDAAALEEVIAAVRDDVYGLALRMLWHPADAEDATQEILVKVFTALSSFEGRSAFRTWVYRVAVRTLLNIKRGRVEPPSLSFDDFRSDLLDGLADPSGPVTPERKMLEKEVRIGCTQAMLLCLDREHRVAYLLGEVLGFGSDEAAACMEVPPATYRKRLSRARSRVEAFMKNTCGLVEREAPCRCAKRVIPAQAIGRVDPTRLLFADHPVAEASPAEVDVVHTRLGEACSAAEVMRANPRYAAPDSVSKRLLRLLAGP